MTIKQAQARCDEWAAVMQSRDRRVIAASEAGLAKSEIGRRMGLGRNTVYAILRKHREQASSE